MTKAIDAGDIVRLISGGPNMTLVRNRITNDGCVSEVVWFDKQDVLHREEVLSRLLQRAPEPVEIRWYRDPVRLPHRPMDFREAFRTR